MFLAIFSISQRGVEVAPQMPIESEFLNQTDLSSSTSETKYQQDKVTRGINSDFESLYKALNKLSKLSPSCG